MDLRAVRSEAFQGIDILFVLFYHRSSSMKIAGVKVLMIVDLGEPIAFLNEIMCVVFFPDVLI